MKLAVEKEHFEWAAKLRDIYVHIEQMVEKQNVELEKPITGYVVEIRQIGEWNVFVLLNFYEGRLIDVIRDKVSVDEGDQDWMLANLEAELGVEFQRISSDDVRELYLSKSLINHKNYGYSASIL